MKSFFLLPLIFFLTSPIQAGSRKDFRPATKAEINLYIQTGVSDFCLSRQSRISFSEAIKTAAGKYAMVVTQKHNGLIEEINIILSKEQLYQGAILQILEGALRTCANSVPYSEKKRFLDTLKILNDY